MKAIKNSYWPRTHRLSWQRLLGDNDKKPITHRETAGFTIVETMIVLAIAGIILLIVFEAIPVLERSGRNNQRRQDVQTILQAVSHWELNNSANIPQWNPALGETTDNFLQHSNLTYYTASNVTVKPAPPYTSGSTYSIQPIPNSENDDQVLVVNYAKCDSNNDGSATNAGASYSDVVALYAIESGNSSIATQCQQL